MAGRAGPSRHETAGASAAEGAAGDVRAFASALDTGVGNRGRQLEEAQRAESGIREELRAVGLRAAIPPLVHPEPERVDGGLRRDSDRRIESLLISLGGTQRDGEVIGQRQRVGVDACCDSNATVHARVWLRLRR
jgi:hypothetical protein